MKVTATSGKLTLEGSDGEDSLRVTGGPYVIRRVLSQQYTEVSVAGTVIKIPTAEVSHLNGSTFSGDTQDIVDALITGLS